MMSREFVYMKKMCSLPSRTFVKLALLQNVCTLVIRCVPPTLFTHKYRGQIMGAVSTTDKTFGPFSEWDFSPRPVYIGSCACVVKIVVKCSFEYLSVVHHTRRHPTTINIM